MMMTGVTCNAQSIRESGYCTERCFSLHRTSPTLFTGSQGFDLLSRLVLLGTLSQTSLLPGIKLRLRTPSTLYCSNIELFSPNKRIPRSGRTKKSELQANAWHVAAIGSMLQMSATLH